jgi:hypothetical protein
VQQGEAEWAAAVDAGRRTSDSDAAVPAGMPEGWASPAASEAAEQEDAAVAGTQGKADADEAQWRGLYEQFVALRQELGERGQVTYEKFAAKLTKNRADLMAKRQCSGVRFSVYEKEGRASIKASAIR